MSLVKDSITGILKGSAINLSALKIVLHDVNCRHEFCLTLFERLSIQYVDLRFNNTFSTILSEFSILCISESVVFTITDVLSSVVEDTIIADDILGFHYLISLQVSLMRKTKLSKTFNIEILDFEDIRISRILSKYLAVVFINDMELLKSCMFDICQCFHVPKDYLISFSSLICYFKVQSISNSIKYVNKIIDGEFLSQLMNKIYPIIEISATSKSIPSEVVLNLLLLIVNTCFSNSNVLQVSTIAIQKRYLEANAMLLMSSDKGLIDTPGFNPFIELLWSLIYSFNNLSENNYFSQESSNINIDKNKGIETEINNNLYCFSCRRISYSPWVLLGNPYLGDINISFQKKEQNQSLKKIHLIPQIICEYCIRNLLVHEIRRNEGIEDFNSTATLCQEVGFFVLPEDIDTFKFVKFKLSESLLSLVPSYFVDDIKPALNIFLGDSIESLDINISATNVLVKNTSSSNMCLAKVKGNRDRGDSKGEDREYVDCDPKGLNLTKVTAVFETKMRIGVDVKLLIDRKEVLRSLSLWTDGEISLPAGMISPMNTYIMLSHPKEESPGSVKLKPRRNSEGSSSSMNIFKIKVSDIRQVKSGSGKFQNCLNMSYLDTALVIKIDDDNLFKMIRNGLLEILSIVLEMK